MLLIFVHQLDCLEHLQSFIRFFIKSEQKKKDNFLYLIWPAPTEKFGFSSNYQSTGRTTGRSTSKCKKMKNLVLIFLSFSIFLTEKTKRWSTGGSTSYCKFSQNFAWAGHSGSAGRRPVGPHSTATHSNLVKGATHLQFGKNLGLFSIWYQFDKTVGTKKNCTFSPNSNLVIHLLICWRWS